MQPKSNSFSDPRPPIDLYEVIQSTLDRESLQQSLETNSLRQMVHAPSARTLSAHNSSHGSSSKLRLRRTTSGESRSVRDTSTEPRRGTSRESRMARTASNESRTRSASNESGISSGRESPVYSASRRSQRPSRERGAFNAARHLVSGNRTRFIDAQYDLDLTYITSRLIAMAFPGEDLLGAFSAVIRNDIRRVFCILLSFFS